MELEINVMSCKDLQSFNFFQKLQIYTVVSITADNSIHIQQRKEEEIINLTAEEKQEQRTPVDYEDGDGNSEWNHTMRFNLSLVTNNRTNIKKLFLHFQLRHHGQFFGDKVIGNVFVPFSDLIPPRCDENNNTTAAAAAAINGTGIVRFVDYQVKSPEGKPNGVIRFSYKVAGIIGHDINHQHQPMNPIVGIAGYPLHQAIHQDQDQNQPMEMEAWKNQYPTIYPPPPQADYTHTAITPSAQPTTAATENHNNSYNYSSHHTSGEFHEPNLMQPIYPPPPPQPPRPLSVWEPPPNTFPPQPYFPPPFSHYRPPPHHHHRPPHQHHHRPFRGPHPRPWG